MTTVRLSVQEFEDILSRKGWNEIDIEHWSKLEDHMIKNRYRYAFGGQTNTVYEQLMDLYCLYKIKCGLSVIGNKRSQVDFSALELAPLANDYWRSQFIRNLEIMYEDDEHVPEDDEHGDVQMLRESEKDEKNDSDETDGVMLDGDEERVMMKDGQPLITKDGKIRTKPGPKPKKPANSTSNLGA